MAETTEALRICELWGLIVERMVAVYGEPLPHEMLTLGNPDKGWGAVLNATRAKQGHHEAYHAIVSWNGFPAGIMEPRGGCIAAGALANEESFREWLTTASPTEQPQP